MAKKTKTSKLYIQARRDIVLNTVRREKYEKKSEILKAVNRNLAEETPPLNDISLATLSRDLEVLGIAIPKGYSHYVYLLDIQEKIDRSDILLTVQENTYGSPISDVNILMVRVETDMADYIGKKIISLLSNYFLDYIPTSNYVLLLKKPATTKEDMKETDKAKAALEDLLHKNTPR